MPIDYEPRRPREPRTLSFWAHLLIAAGLLVLLCLVLGWFANFRGFPAPSD